MSLLSCSNFRIANAPDGQADLLLYSTVKLRGGDLQAEPWPSSSRSWSWAGLNQSLTLTTCGTARQGQAHP